MFFSLPQLSSNTAKKEALPPKSKHSKGYWANSSKNLKNSGKAWEFPEKHGKYRKNMGNPEKSWEIPGMHGKSWESTGNHRKSCEILAKAVKTQEMLLKPRIMLKPGKSRVFF